ncbi:MAG: hypothetical protein HYT20_00175 [Candidatus Nealsonbacteria bacterium]|nr:hypothetical protein [Candidatus Nealsonbacteria bacterium]
MKKIFLVIFLFLFLGISQVQAALVTCGPGIVEPANRIDATLGYVPCEFCDIFVMGSNLLEWIFTWVVPTVASLMFIIGGVLLLFAGAKADAFNKAKGVITAAVVGLLIIFAAWVIVNTVFDKIGVVELGNGWKWYNIQCKTP